MKGRHRISRRAIKRFLQLAATAFAIGVGTTPALADDSARQPATDSRDDDAHTDDAAAEARHGYRHRFALAGMAAGAHAPGGALAHLRVLDAGGRKVVHLALHGDSMVGPLAHGSYTVLLRANGLTEVHRIRIGSDTLPYLHFTETI
ncbi:hypothetical protein [Thauera sinica]|uniref:Uncharacterized protein n=1 Tax=Thauera sinica TaxID=2665146 RepID=A0ABW1AR40_9RHOO|nr:hypothetical protein [Thauera sp. K11]ATE59744.1 hypothetical protein CCZ27_07090 [Thauera sp. K11]